MLKNVYQVKGSRKNKTGNRNTKKKQKVHKRRNRKYEEIEKHEEKTNKDKIKKKHKKVMERKGNGGEETLPRPQPITERTR
jgi:hypothetical protein